MAVLVLDIFDIHDIVYSINEFIKGDNNLLNCNKYLYGLKLKYLKYYNFHLLLDPFPSSKNNSLLPN